MTRGLRRPLLMHKLTAQSIFQRSTNVRPILPGPVSKLKNLSVALASALRSELGKLVYIFGFLGIEPFSQALYSVGRIIEYSRQSFARYEQHVVMNPTNPKPTLFTKMLQKVEGEESLPRDDLIREGQAYIVAGSDTTALTSTYFVYAVTRHPEVREKLIAELSTLPSNFGWEEIRYLPYLNKCIDETLRLHGVASSALPRIVPSGGARLAGYGKFTSPSFLTTQLQLTLGPEFPSGFIVSTQAYSLHRNPSIFVDPLRLVLHVLAPVPCKLLRKKNIF